MWDSLLSPPPFFFFFNEGSLCPRRSIRNLSAQKIRTAPGPSYTFPILAASLSGELRALLAADQLLGQFLGAWDVKP